jgi:geranylgeranyl reductase family protein
MDVVIVGGGPAGLLVAARCAQAGLDVLLCEEHPVVGQPVHCTGVISLEAANLAKVPDEIVLKRLTRARLHSPAGESCEIAWEGEAYEQILAIDRAAFDRGLATQAVEAGAIVRTAMRVTDVIPEEDGVVVIAGAEFVWARACVLACGVSYRLQRRLGLGLPGQVVQTAQLEVDAAPTDVVELHFGRRVAPAGFAWVVPVARGAHNRLKVGVLAAGDAGACLDRVLDQPALRGRLEAAPGRPIRRLLPLRVIGKTYGPRLLVVGDAGGFTKPTTGGGIFYSLLTASLAAETLIEGFRRGRLDEAFLSRYEDRWRERLGKELKLAAWFRYVLARLTDAEIDVLVRALVSDDLQALIRSAARFNWHRDLILALVRQRGLARVLFGALFR